MTTFYSSAELRWFLHDQPHRWDSLLTWFRRDNEFALRTGDTHDAGIVTDSFVQREPERTDEYLLLPDCETVGVKQRQGKLEVKALVGSARPYAVAAAEVHGRVDQWVKWSFASQMQAQLEVELRQAAPWSRVAKVRYLQKYSADSTTIVAVTPESRPEAGCNVELTRISVDAAVRDWLTIGFEAFGPSARVVAILEETVEQFFAAHGPAPVALEGRDSRSYPAWLADLT